MAEEISAVLVGAGQRGTEVYGSYALRHPDQITFVAVAEPDPERRTRFASQHAIPTERQFHSWEPLFELPPLGQAAVISTQDQAHLGPAVAALQAGYHVLLEKPMATTARDCRQLVREADAANRQLHICHVLRFTTHFEQIKEIVRSGVLGQLINIDHRENVSWWHMTHSFVRGNWRRQADGSPMILAKCCHDFDILIWLLGDRCQSISSVGELRHFRPENAPPGAPERCLDGCPAAEECPHYAPFVYQGLVPMWRSLAHSSGGLTRMAAQLQVRAPTLVHRLAAVAPPLRQIAHYQAWPLSVLTTDQTPAGLQDALRHGPYGRCVYRCDNDVVDHQVVTMHFEDGPSATLTMQGHSHWEERTTRIEASRGSLQARFGLGGSWIETMDHRSGRRRRFDSRDDPREGHGGGDTGLMHAFVRALRGKDPAALSGARQALASHLLAFAAEQARLERRTLHLHPPIARLGES